MDGSVTLTTEHHSYELPISAQLGDSYDDNGDNAEEYGDNCYGDKSHILCDTAHDDVAENDHC